MRRLILALPIVLGLACGCSNQPDLEKAAQRDARAAMARGDYHTRPMDEIKDETSRRYQLAYNTTILLEQPPITPANRLEERIAAMARDHSAANNRAFEEALLAESVYVPTTKDGALLAKARPSSVTFLKMPIEDGRRAMVVFTSPDRLRQAFHNDTEWYMLGLTGRQALEAGKGAPVVVNYALRPPVYIEPAQVEALLAPAPKPAA